jgi:hypothetical protein
MTRDIRPLTPNDLPEVSRFLTAGFHTPPDSGFARPEVLRWKYLEPLEANAGKGASGEGAPLSYVARDEAGQIIGHIGICRTAFEGRAMTQAGGQTATIHIIDWLGSPEHRAVGMSLMRKAHEGVSTQFGLGVSHSALVVGERAGYELRNLVPVYVRILRLGYWLRTSNVRPRYRALRIAHAFLGRLMQPTPATRVAITPMRVSRFGAEIDPIVRKAKEQVILTRRDPARLDRFLRFPGQAMSGWHLCDGTGSLRGFALLNLVPTDQGRTLTGKIVDCLLDDSNVHLWQAAVRTLTHELANQGADIAQAYASTPWTVGALQKCGYTSRYSVKFHIRDRSGLVPRDAVFHLTPLEGDYAYT